MEKISLNVKMLEKCAFAASKDKNRFILNSVCVRDREVKGEKRRYYEATNGRILVRCFEVIENIEIKELVLSCENIKKTKGIYVEFDRNSDYLLNKKYGIIEILDGSFPNTQDILKYDFDKEKLLEPKVFRRLDAELLTKIEKFCRYGIDNDEFFKKFSVVCLNDTHRDFIIYMNKETEDLAIIMPIR